jgi:CDP-glucose 4,6-dehydratase
VDKRQGALEIMEVSAQRNPNPEFWRGKRVLLTGHSGFKGAWLSLWLHRLGAQVTGISLLPATQPNLFTLADIAKLTTSHISDIRDAGTLTPLIRDTGPDIVLHLAAQALVRFGYRDPVGTFATNTMGTVHVLDALRGVDTVRVAAIITTDKVYRNLERVDPYREDDSLGGHDPYSASKAAAEIVIASYRDAFLKHQGVAVASARAGNVIGGGDWSEDRLIPDAVRAWSAGLTLHIRRPQAVRPWQHVLEPLAGYLRLVEELWQRPDLAGAYNFGPHTHEAVTVREVVGLARDAYGRADVTWGDGSDGPHEAGLLALEISKARETLGVMPRWNLGVSVKRSLDWYLRLAAGADARQLCEADIAVYEAAA